jgi:hypothetical protein
MNRPRLVRWLRIAWSVFWGTACVLVFLLWGKSFPIDGHIVTFGDPVPFFLLAVLIGVLAYLPWNRLFWRFSLRTLLIATTLVAVGLGLKVFLGHRVVRAKPKEPLTSQNCMWLC